jgi:carboxymethylenebutenolidase
MGSMIELTAADGHRLAAYRVDPTGKPRGGIVVIQEIFGVNGHIKKVADGYAEEGYCAIAPAIFDRVQRGVSLGYTADDIVKGRALKEQCKFDTALLDVAAAVKAAGETGKVGVVGYCWGGFLAWMAAARVDGIAGAVPYYGGGVTDQIGSKPKCPVMLHFGEKDAHIPVAGVKQLAAAHPAHPVHIYPADHGFNCDERASYHETSAKLARSRTLAFFREHVG